MDAKGKENARKGSSQWSVVSGQFPIERHRRPKLAKYLLITEH